MHIQSIPMCELSSFSRQICRASVYSSVADMHCLGTGSSDNYAYLVVDDKSKDAAIIDPAHPEEYV